jgi:hypothetical protein
MDFQRRSANQRCQHPTHKSCDSCGEYIRRNSRHAHHTAERAGEPETQLCGECLNLVEAASMPVMRALAKMGWQGSARELLRLLDRGDVAILYSVPLPVE